MQREIKFRAWDKQEGKMYEWENFGFGRRDLYLNWNRVIGDPDRFNIMQFTGLKDKNGKEIYEEDILRIGEGLIREVYWDEDNSRWGMKDQTTFGPIIFERWAEVIGNIYENPELLKP